MQVNSRNDMLSSTRGLWAYSASSVDDDHVPPETRTSAVSFKSRVWSIVSSVGCSNSESALKKAACGDKLLFPLCKLIGEAVSDSNGEGSGVCAVAGVSDTLFRALNGYKYTKWCDDMNRELPNKVYAAIGEAIS